MVFVQNGLKPKPKSRKVILIMEKKKEIIFGGIAMELKIK